MFKVPLRRIHCFCIFWIFKWYLLTCPSRFVQQVREDGFFLRFSQNIFRPPLLNHVPATPEGLAALWRHWPNQLGAHGEFCSNISMKFAVNWFHNVNLALYSNRIMPDRCLVHRYSNRSDMNAGISAHFSPTIKSKWDTWLRFMHTHRANLNPSGIKFVAGVFSPFHRGMFFKSVVVGLFLAQFLQYGRSSQGNNLPNDNTAR